MGWWDDVKPGDNLRVVFFQVDLSGHSRWSEGTGSKYTTAKQRADFAEELKDELRQVGFDCLYWLGDGGLFARRFGRKLDAEQICEAARRAFHCFNRWLKKYQLEDSGLGLRVSGTYDYGVIVDPEPGNWFSTEMNYFLKYERDIAYRNAFVITEELRREMDPHGPAGEAFDKKYIVKLPAVPKLVKTMWAHKDFPREIMESPRHFGVWLSQQTVRGELPAGLFGKKEVESWHQVGKSVIMDTAKELDGYRHIELIRVPWASPKRGVLEEDRDVWRRNREAYANKTGTRLSVVKFRGELKDDPIVRLEYRDVSYPDVRAFHDILEYDLGASRRYLKRARRVTQDGTELPNTLSNHIVVLLNSGGGGRDVLIAHRRKGGRAGTWFANCWSFSIEEQYNPVREEIDGREIEQDEDVHGAIERGVREELLGNEYSGPIEVGVYAFQMESVVMNFGFLAIVDLPEISFEKLKEYWSSGRAIDSEEHDVIAALPLEPNLLWQCLKSDALPSTLWKNITKAGKRYGEDLEFGDHNWHPTSHARVALTLWFESIGRAERW